MASVRNLITNANIFPTIKPGSKVLIIDNALIRAINNRATFNQLRVWFLIPREATPESYKGLVNVFYNANEFVSYDRTFRNYTSDNWDSEYVDYDANKALLPTSKDPKVEVDIGSGHIRLYYKLGSQYENINYVYMYLNIDFFPTNVSNINIGANTDYRQPIIITWDSAIQDAFEANIIQNNVTVYTATGLSQKTLTIPSGKLQTGEFIVSLTTANNPYENWGEAFTNTVNFTATSSPPVIIALEPDNINQSVDSAINVTWISSLQQLFTLKIYSDNKLVKTYQGETEKFVKIPGGTLPTGNIKLDLTISNKINNITLTANKQVTFLGYGKPPLPIFEDKIIYTEALPTINWTAVEQTDFQIEIYKGQQKVEDSGIIANQVTSYKVKNALENNTLYTIKLKVRNQFQLWSEQSIKDITISYTEIPKPNLTLVRDSGGILVTIIYSENVVNLKSLEIWRKDSIEDYKRMAFDLKTTSQWLDTTVASGVPYTYKVRAVSKEGGITESDSLIEKAFVKNFNFENIETKEKQKLMINPSISISKVVDITIRNFAGEAKAKIERGPKNYKRLNCTFTIESSKYRELEDFFNKGRVVLFRDGRGEKFYGAITSPINSNYTNLNKSQISFTFEELNFFEKDMYSDQKLVLTYFNGAYFFDGSIDFSGENLQ